MKTLYLFVLLLFALGGLLPADTIDNQLRLCLRSDPKTFDPLLAQEESSETIRYLTSGVLIRLNRTTQKLEPELATSWKIADQGTRIIFSLRKGVRFSDGTPFTAQDVAATVRRMMEPNLHSPIGDSFRAGGGEVRAVVDRPDQVTILFPTAISGVERLFDQVAIASSNPHKKAVLGPFFVAEHRAGSYVLLQRNPNYWRRDARGRRLPYLESIRLDIQSNRDIEMLRFRRGEIHMISGLDPVAFERLKTEDSSKAIDAGPTQDSEMMWFNQVKRASIPDYKKAWFAAQPFRRAVSGAINRQDIARLVYAGHAKPAAGPFSETNTVWFNRSLKPHAYSPAESLRALQQAGFVLRDRRLYDAKGNRVEFSLITNSGNKGRLRIASLLQQDLSKIGIKLNVVPLDFPALIERITRTYAYESCLLGLTNVDTEPGGQMNVWLSSAANHQWNPLQKSPETAWEAEIDRLMRAQASSISLEKRRASFNRVQAIVSEQTPFIYLVHKNALLAVDPRLSNLAPSPAPPNLLWNVHQLGWKDLAIAKR